jgi:hypothetical protein
LTDTFLLPKIGQRVIIGTGCPSDKPWTGFARIGVVRAAGVVEDEEGHHLLADIFVPSLDITIYGALYREFRANESISYNAWRYMEDDDPALLPTDPASDNPYAGWF